VPFDNIAVTATADSTGDTNREIDSLAIFLENFCTGGVKLPQALAELGLIDEYEFVVHPRLAGHGPTLFAGLSKHVDLRLVSRLELGSGAVAMRYEPRR
jgi:dihydrofolate reductase